MLVKIKKLSKDAIVPKRATKGSVAYDLYTPKDYTIEKGRQILPMDFAIELQIGYEAKIEPRSGFSSKGMEGIMADKQVRRLDADVLGGKVDSDFRGNVGVIVKSNEFTNFVIPKGTKIAQLTIYKVEDADFVLFDKLSETERGEGGFGHTDKK